MESFRNLESEVDDRHIASHPVLDFFMQEFNKDLLKQCIQELVKQAGISNQEKDWIDFFARVFKNGKNLKLSLEKYQQFQERLLKLREEMAGQIAFSEMFKKLDLTIVKLYVQTLFNSILIGKLNKPTNTIVQECVGLILSKKNNFQDLIKPPLSPVRGQFYSKGIEQLFALDLSIRRKIINEEKKKLIAIARSSIAKPVNYSERIMQIKEDAKKIKLLEEEYKALQKVLTAQVLELNKKINDELDKYFGFSNSNEMEITTPKKLRRTDSITRTSFKTTYFATSDSEDSEASKKSKQHFFLNYEALLNHFSNKHYFNEKDKLVYQKKLFFYVLKLKHVEDFKKLNVTVDVLAQFFMDVLKSAIEAFDWKVGKIGGKTIEIKQGEQTRKMLVPTHIKIIYDEICNMEKNHLGQTKDPVERYNSLIDIIKNAQHPYVSFFGLNRRDDETQERLNMLARLTKITKPQKSHLNRPHTY